MPYNPVVVAEGPVWTTMPRAGDHYAALAVSHVAREALLVELPDVVRP